VAWDALQLTYFTARAVWTCLTVPFVLTQPGFETEELEPWAEDGEIWGRLRAVFPARIASHGADHVAEWAEIVIGVLVFLTPWALGFTGLTAMAWSVWIAGTLAVVLAGSVVLNERNRPRLVGQR
jgi:SPW repeat-containing protein